jgi:C4-type Zn-finger protein
MKCFSLKKKGTNMKCPVCSKGEIVNYNGEFETFDPTTNKLGFQTLYYSKCNKCNLRTDNYKTRSEAEEAMRPVVSEELIREVFKIGQRYTYKMFYENGIGLIEFIKQELEKFRNKE